MIGDDKKDTKRVRAASSRVGKRESRVRTLNNSSVGKESLSSDAVKELLREISKLA